MDARDRSELQAMTGKVGELSAKIDLLLERTNVGREVDQDHELRLRSVERFKYSLPMALIVALATAIATVLRAQ